MTRARLCLVVPLLLTACERAGSSTTTTPTDPTKPVVADPATPVASGDSLPIVAVPQRLPSIDPALWIFDPSGRLIAEEFSDDESGAMGCGVWDIESGTFVRAYLYDETVDEQAFDPCVDWDGDPRLASDTSVDGKLRAYVDGGLEIEVVDGPSRAVRGCASCDGAMAWAPSGHQLATANGTLLEIWDADTGKRLRSETLGLGDVMETLLGWTDQGIGVVVLHEISAPCEELEPDGMYCSYDGYDEDGEPLDEPHMTDGFALSSFWWPADGSKPVARVEQFKSAEMPDFYADVGVRWFAFSKGVDFDRDGTSTTLYVSGVGSRTSALGWTESDSGSDEEWSEPWDGRWRVDTATRWIEGLTSGYGEDYYGSLELGWNEIVTEPNPAMYRGQVVEIEGGGPSGEIEVFAASGGAAVTRWEACVDEDETCKSGAPPVRDCELLDVSPTLSLALVDCGGGLRMLEASRGSAVFSLRQDPSAEWRWGRGNYLALLDVDGKASVVDLGTGKSLYQRDDVLELLEVPLAAEQDRLAFIYADHLEIVAGPTGARIIDVPGDWAAAALSPDGKQIATLGANTIQIMDIAGGKIVATATTAGETFKIAWRQDGKALFYGLDWPTHAIDPQTGELLHELSNPILDVMDLEDIDPSWRWIHRPDGSIVRTLDFARIELGPSWAQIDSGMFEGELGDLPDDLRYRVGDDPNAPAIYTAAELDKWLRSPGLVRAFFDGKPLPSPRVPVDAVAKLGQGKTKD